MDPENRAVAKEFDAYHDRYGQAVDAALAFSGFERRFFVRAKAGYLLDVLRRAFGGTEALKVLDIGCGVGTYHPLLRHRFAELTGVDISEASIRRAAEDNPGLRYDAYDGRTLPYPDGSFDVAFAICVLHHVRPAAWSAFATEMKRVLRPGGAAIVFEHNPRNPLTLRVVERCAFDRDAVLLRANKTAALLKEVGLVRIRRRFILSIPAANAPLRAIDRLFSLLPFGAQYYVSAFAPERSRERSS